MSAIDLLQQILTHCEQIMNRHGQMQQLFQQWDEEDKNERNNRVYCQHDRQGYGNILKQWLERNPVAESTIPASQAMQEIWQQLKGINAWV